MDRFIDLKDVFVVFLSLLLESLFYLLNIWVKWNHLGCQKFLVGRLARRAKCKGKFPFLL
jgi:hypothetical protein